MRPAERRPARSRADSRNRSDALAYYLADIAVFRLVDREHEVRFAQDIESAARELGDRLLRTECCERPRASESRCASRTEPSAHPGSPDADPASLTMEALSQACARLREDASLDAQTSGELEARWARLLECNQRFVSHNLKLVVAVAKDFRGTGLPLEDLVQEGNIGLIRAVQKYDHRRGVKFSTYAVWWIRQAIIRAIQNQGRVVRLPVYTLEQLRRYKRAQSELVRLRGEAPSTDALCERLQIAAARVQELEQLCESTLSLDLHHERNSESGGPDWPECTDPCDPQLALVERESEQRALCALAALDPREQQIVRWRYGLGEEAPLTLRSIAGRLRVSAERVRQIEQRAIGKLRKLCDAEERCA